MTTDCVECVKIQTFGQECEDPVIHLHLSQLQELFKIIKSLDTIIQDIFEEINIIKDEFDNNSLTLVNTAIINKYFAFSYYKELDFLEKKITEYNTKKV